MSQTSLHDETEHNTAWCCFSSKHIHGMGSTVTLFIRARTGARKEDLRNSRVLCLVNLAIHYSLYLIRSLRSNDLLGSLCREYRGILQQTIKRTYISVKKES